MVTLEQMIVFFIMIIVGVFARRHKLINDEGIRQISAVIVNISTPALIISAGFFSDHSLSLSEMLLGFALGCGLFAVLILLAETVPALFGFAGRDRQVLKLSLVFCNIMFMGLPLLANVYGSRAVLYLMLFNFPSSLLLYTYAILVMRGGGGSHLGGALKKMINPGTVAAVIAFTLYFAQPPIPRVISQPIVMLGSVTGPVAMLLIGASLADLKILSLFSDIRLLGFAAFKMFFMPLAVVLLLKQFIADLDLLGTCMILVAAPTGNMIAMLSSVYCPEAAPAAVRSIALTTLLSVLTLPLVAIISGIG